MKPDTVTVSVIRGALEQIADEMDTQLIRAALSPIISEMSDCAHGIFHAETGETIAQGRHGLPVFLANMQFTVEAVIAHIGGAWEPGDVWVLNTPYLSGTHLPDVCMVAPYFYGDEVVAVLASTGHWVDIGGSVAGGWAPTAREIHAEGIVLPPTRLVRGGAVNESVVDIIRANVRVPDQIQGDAVAMMNVFPRGAARLDRVIERYGLETLRAVQDELIVRSEAAMRSYVSEIPDGVYEYADALDNDGIVDTPMAVRVRIEVSGSEMHVDFAGTAPPSPGPLNLPVSTTISSCYVAMKHVFPDVPVNGGTFRPVTIAVPEDSCLAAQYPSAVGGYLELVSRVIDVVFGALAQAIPDRVPGAPFGTTGAVTFAGIHPATGRYFVGGYPYAGGYGASAGSDGQVHGNTVQSSAQMYSIERSEHRFPIRFDFFRLREDSGGAGKHRGGCGSEYRWRALAPCTAAVLGDRADHPPFGVAGGRSAARNEVILHTDGTAWNPPMRSKHADVSLAPGDGIEVRTPGGGGFGDPLERSVAAVEEDVRRGFVSEAYAREVYGAIFTTEAGGRLEIDLEKTRARRAAMHGGLPVPTAG